MTEKKCYGCKHRRSISGDAHSMCQHPDVPKAENMFEGFFLKGKNRVSILKAADALNIQANYHGIKNGWFHWPYNFDPVWLNNCDGFEPKERE